MTYVMHSNKTGNKLHRPILRYGQLKLVWKITHLSILRFLFFTYLNVCFLPFSSNFWLIFKHFPTKHSALSAACHTQNYSLGIQNFRGWFLKTTLPEKPLTVLYTNGHIPKSRRSMNLMLVSNLSWKCAPYSDTRNSVSPKCHLFPILCIAYLPENQGRTQDLQKVGAECWNWGKIGWYGPKIGWICMI